MDAEYFYEQGLTAAVRGKVDESVENFEKAIQLDSSMVPAYHQLGKVCMKHGRVREAVTHLREALNRRPQQAAIHVDLGFAYLGCRDLDRAQDAFLSGLALEQNDVRALNGLSTTFFFLEHWERLRAHADAVLKLNPDSFAALFFRGCAAFQLGDFASGEKMFDRAGAVLDKLLAMQPQSVEAVYLQGEIKWYRGAYGSARERYMEAQKLIDPVQTYWAYGIPFTGLDVLVKIGMCYKHLSNAVRAAEIAEQIRAVQPDHPAIAALTATE